MLTRTSKCLVPGLATVTVALAVALAACSSSDDEAQQADNGVNDVKLACEQRATFALRTSDKCVSCLAAASLAGCDCEAFKGFGGVCAAQGDARRAEPTCTTALGDCVRACADDDCNCIDACYAGADACKRVSAAEDGCVAKVCEPYCN